jgi:hypothetical protein
MKGLSLVSLAVLVSSWGMVRHAVPTVDQIGGLSMAEWRRSPAPQPSSPLDGLWRTVGLDAGELARLAIPPGRQDGSRGAEEAYELRIHERLIHLRRACGPRNASTERLLGSVERQTSPCTFEIRILREPIERPWFEFDVDSCWCKGELQISNRGESMIVRWPGGEVEFVSANAP